MERKIRHLEMIQRVITRMAGNLFLLKGWSITLIVAVFAILGKEINYVSILFGVFIIFIFWILDGYFLSMERCFRGLYDYVRSIKNEDIDFSMNFSKYNKGKNTWGRAMFSKTLLIFYIPLLVIMLIAILTTTIEGVSININIDWVNSEDLRPIINTSIIELIEK